MSDFLPICRADMKKRGWDQCDFVYIIGDAYVDHPSFGPAIISRVLESHGYKVGIISQPDWTDENSIQVLGKPRLGFLVCAGNMDSMVNHYTVAKKKRSKDAYTPGGVIGKRPDRATIVYCNLIRKVYKQIPIVIGGIEASLRRLSHYDYWQDKVKRSVLLDSSADILIYGMGERPIVEVADALEAGIAAKDITYIRGTVVKRRDLEGLVDYIELPTFEEVITDKKAFAKSFYEQYCNTDPVLAKTLVEKYKDYEFVVQNSPAYVLSQEEMDAVYDLPYTRKAHPELLKKGSIAATEEIKFSLTSCRGCFGSCNYCALTFHQGRVIQTRSHESIIKEAKLLTEDPDFKGYISDVGGPTANFRRPACDKQLEKGACKGKTCLAPVPCKNLKVDHSDYVALLRKLRALPKVKKVFIRSGIRFDYLVYDKDKTFMKELCKYHISGQLKVAPEHVSDHVLELMGKPPHSVYEQFRREYKRTNEELMLKQFDVPYLISSHPGTTLQDAIKLAEYLKSIGHKPEQVQDFYPTPGTISTCMYYTELDPRTMKPVYVPKKPHEKAMQRALIQYTLPENHKLVVEALREAGRDDLIGDTGKCLVKDHVKSKSKESKSGNGSFEKKSYQRKRTVEPRVDSKNKKYSKKH